MILVLRGDGDVEEHEYPSDFLRFCYQEIRCELIEHVRLSHDMSMWVDESGMYTQDINLPATLVANTCGYAAEWIYGDVVITGIENGCDGYLETSLSAANTEKVKKILSVKHK